MFIDSYMIDKINKFSYKRKKFISVKKGRT